MTYCPDYYNADEYVNTFYSESENDEPTKCSCGQPCERGNVYCEYCKDVIDTAMSNAINSILRYCDFSEDEAEEAVAYWLNCPEYFTKGE